MAVHCFVGRDDLPNVKGLVVAGLADLKSELASPKILDKRLLAKVLKVVDISYGMEKGLHQAVALSADVLGEVRLLKEQRLLERYFHELVSADGGKAACGMRETIAALHEGVVDSIVCWEHLPVLRYTVQHAATDRTEVLHYTPRKGVAHAEPTVREVLESHRATMVDPQQWSILKVEPLVDWLAEHYREFGAQLSFVSGNSELGNQFVQSFGGLGAVLRYRIDFESLGLGEQEAGDDEQAGGGDEYDDFDDFTYNDTISSEPKPVDPKEEVLEFDESDFEDDNGEEHEQPPAKASPPGETRRKDKEKLADGENDHYVREPPVHQRKDERQPASGAAAQLSRVKYTDKVFVPCSGSATANEARKY